MLSPGSMDRYIMAFSTVAVFRWKPAPPRRLFSPNVAVIYSARKRVSHATLPALSVKGFVSIMAISLITTALNGLACIFPISILPSILSLIMEMAFLAALVCTPGACTAIPAAMMTVTNAIPMRYNILAAFLISLSNLNALPEALRHILQS